MYNIGLIRYFALLTPLCRYAGKSSKLPPPNAIKLNYAGKAASKTTRPETVELVALSL